MPIQRRARENQPTAPFVYVLPDGKEVQGGAGEGSLLGQEWLRVPQIWESFFTSASSNFSHSLFCLFFYLKLTSCGVLLYLHFLFATVATVAIATAQSLQQKLAVVISLLLLPLLPGRVYVPTSLLLLLMLLY